MNLSSPLTLMLDDQLNDFFKCSLKQCRHSWHHTDSSRSVPFSRIMASMSWSKSAPDPRKVEGKVWDERDMFPTGPRFHVISEITRPDMGSRTEVLWQNAWQDATITAQTSCIISAELPSVIQMTWSEWLDKRWETFGCVRLKKDKSNTLLLLSPQCICFRSVGFDFSWASYQLLHHFHIQLNLIVCKMV